MTDPVSTAASAVTLIEKAAAVYRKLTGRQPAPRAAHRKLFALRAIPVVVQINLSSNAPRVSVEFRVVNYQRKPVAVRDLVVERLTVGSVAVDTIPLTVHVTIPPLSDCQLFCERPLYESEFRTLAAAYREEVAEGGLNYSGLGFAGSRAREIGPEQGIRVQVVLRQSE